ncbi:MAG: PIN domain-containing protein [Fibromonadaceae bacterium]|jgi:predicted nucleic acid-binding protein|nr:PIN domain-containing protein [Fibromonadaceae bacterium]
MNRIALDSNILIYNHSLDYENKRLIARDFFKENPIISSQVISEYINVMKRNFKMQKQELLYLCSLWLEKCSIQPVVLSTIKLAQNLINRYDFQIFDGIIIAAALEANCDILYSEDMQNGQIIENTLKIVNPFAD